MVIGYIGKKKSDGKWRKIKNVECTKKERVRERGGEGEKGESRRPRREPDLVA